MKTSTRIEVMALLLGGLAACTAAGGEERQLTSRFAPRGYRVVALPSHGSATSEGLSINDDGWIAGTSPGPEVDTIQASLWIAGVKLDLGTLGGPNSAVLWPVKNTSGMISGVAETADLDPLLEDWSCSAFFPTTTHHVCRGFVWEDGEMRALPTLGGTHGFATGTNNLGQTVGWSETDVFDSTCNPPQRLQFLATLWGPGHDQIQSLPPLPGDTTSAATAVNDLGQVAGISGICSNSVGGRSAAHAVLWDGGTVTDIGNFGGIAWNTPMGINGHGDIVGFANQPTASPPTRFRPQAFVWTATDGIHPIELLPGDTRSQGLGINDRGQVVGTSCAATCRGFLFEDGVVRDLNELVVSGMPGTIVIAGDINDDGVITGRLQMKSGETSAFVAVPL